MGNPSILILQKEITELEQTLDAKKRQLEEVLKQGNSLHTTLAKQSQDTTLANEPLPEALSPPETKIALFRSLFRGRDDVYAKRFESRKTGKSGYHPACRNVQIRLYN